MNRSTFILIAIAFIAVCSSSKSKFGEMEDAISSYNIHTESNSHKDNLRFAIRNRFGSSISSFTYVDVFVRIPQLKNLTVNPSSVSTRCAAYTTGITTKSLRTTTGSIQAEPSSDLRLDYINSVNGEVRKAVNDSGCEIIHSSVDLLIKGDLFTNSFEIGIKCPNDSVYLNVLTENPLFVKHVVWAGNGYQLKDVKGISVLSGPISKSTKLTTKRIETRQQGRTSSSPPPSPPPPPPPSPPPPTPYGGDPNIPGYCNHYNNHHQNPYSNWYADGLNGVDLDCRPINDSSAYNKGKGATIYLIDSGVYRNHREFVGQDVRTVCVLEPEAYEPFGINCHDDDVSHGTTLAAIAVGNSLGLVKNATLISYKVFGRADDGDGPYDVAYEPAIKKAIDKIVESVTSVCPENSRPNIAMTAYNFIYWNEDCFTKDKYLTYDGVDLDCTLGMMAKLIKLISNGVVLQMAVGNGWLNTRDIDYSNNEMGFPVGLDICHWGKWKMDYADELGADFGYDGGDYMYYPAYSILDGNVFSGYSHVRPFRVGANDKFGKARSWLAKYFNGQDYSFAIGASNWGNNNCMDWTAPGIELDRIAVVPNTIIDSWYEDYPGYDPYWNTEGFNATDGYFGQGLKSSATSWSVAVAASAIVSAMVDNWSFLRPVTYPDYGYPRRVHKFIQLNNLASPRYYTSEHIHIEYEHLRDNFDPLIPKEIENVTSRPILLRPKSFYYSLSQQLK